MTSMRDEDASAAERILIEPAATVDFKSASTLNASGSDDGGAGFVTNL
jgi:hypothetical protein